MEDYNHLSRFTHVIPIEDSIAAVFNSLWLRVVFIEAQFVPFIKRLQKGETPAQVLKSLTPEQIPEGNNLLESLKQQKFFDIADDERKLKEIKYEINQQPISMMYLILTQSCNLACKYCYLAEALRTGSNMSVSVVQKAVDFFSRLIRQNGVKEPHILLYGGEPLVNLSTFEFALEYANKRLPDCQFTLNTNGTLITPRVIELLREYRVTVVISIDGPREVHDRYRVTHNGQGSFNNVMLGYQKLQEENVGVGISCTITWDNVHALPEITKWLIDTQKVKSIGFNLMMGEFGDLDQMANYSTKASKALIESFVIARRAGVYEDRMMRRVEALADGKIWFNDCGGCGQQIVVTPEGKLGVCQAFLNTGENLISPEQFFDAEQQQLWSQWRQRSPFNIRNCLKCEALGICGGGCPYNSLIRNGDIMTLDSVHCVHAKDALRFLLTDLWRKSSDSLVYS